MTTNTPERPWQRGFWSLIVTQFQGAFSDNALKTVVTFFGLSLALPAFWHRSLVPIATGIFSLPFILFSMAGGFFADRYSKRTVTIGIKVFEIAIMSFATAAFLTRNLWMGMTAIFLMGTHSAIFGPSKYGSLPELLPEKQLSWGNGILELGTFLAIILGAAAGGYLFDWFRSQLAHVGFILIALAVLGLLTSLGITRVPAAAPTQKFKANFLGDLVSQIRLMRQDRVLWLACLGNIYFSFVGQFVFQGVFDLGDRMHLAEKSTSLLVVALALGIGIGSFAAGYLSGGKIEYGLVPLGALGLTVFSFVLGRPDQTFHSLCPLLGMLGFFGGFFIVPISALLQHRPSKEQRGAVLAASNLLSFVGIFLAAGVYWVLTSPLNLTPHHMFIVAAIMTLVATGYVIWLLPDSLLRLFVWAFTHSIYRLRVEGRDNIPEKGGALFVCNHVSFVDALLLIGSTDRMIRAIMFKDIYDHWLVKPFAKAMKAIPISSHLRPREMIKSLREASEAIKNGDVVCIFAEGQITRIGQMLPFRRGFERIMKDVDAPIIPICLDHVWGSIFSYEKKRFLWKVPRYFPYPVTVSFGKPMPPTSTPFEVRERVQELNTDAWQHRKKQMMTIPRAFVRKARHHPRRFFMADARVPHLSFGAALTRTILLARRLRAGGRDRKWSAYSCRLPSPARS